MIAMGPMLEAGMLQTARNYWFGKKDKPAVPTRPDEGSGSMREKFMTAAKKQTSEGEGGVGGAIRNVMNKNRLLAQAGEM
ncbi:MAG: hypothetical protein R3250_03180 [Melioribacteraceae bacterium]|nr:hypothetical protein [Melioribacteraceae bacterium]